MTTRLLTTNQMTIQQLIIRWRERADRLSEMAEAENVNDIVALEYLEHSTAIRDCADDVEREVLSSGGGGAEHGERNGAQQSGPSSPNDLSSATGAEKEGGS